MQEKSRTQLQLSSLKNDCSLFSRLYIASKIRSADLDQFFQYENQAYPPALSQMGKLWTGTKSDLVGCLEDIVHTQDLSPTPIEQVIMLDGAAIDNMFRPGFAKTFSDYATQVFLPHITSQLQLQHVNRLDVVWDEYIADSLKAETRTRTGKGIRRRVEPSNSIPGNWQDFSALTITRSSCFRSWRLVQQPLPPTNKSSAYVTLVCCVLSPDTCQALLHAHMKKRIHESYSTWKML